MLDPTAVTADQLHPRAGQGDVEDAGVGGVGQPQPHDLACPEGKTKVGVAGDQQPVAEAAHGRVAGLGGAERCDLAVLDENVVQSQDQVAVGRRPVVGVGGDDKDVAVQAEFLGVVLPDVRVVPVQAWVRELEAVAELPTHRDRRLGLVGDAVVAVLQPQPVPVDGRVKVTVVLNVDHDLGALSHLEGGAGDGAVVAQHPHGGVAERLGHRADAQF